MRHEGSFFCMEGGERIENVIGRIEEIHLQRFHRLECFAGFEGEFASKGIVQKKHKMFMIPLSGLEDIFGRTCWWFCVFWG